uniref:Uncharacterized protein n=1 Tax=Arion vulgaris TaxID=1028688 RepID=A0A0B6ZRK1_9EUPU
MINDVLNIVHSIFTPLVFLCYSVKSWGDLRDIFGWKKRLLVSRACKCSKELYQCDLQGK